MTSSTDVESGAITRTLSCFGATAVIAGCMIGSGVFANAVVVYQNVPFSGLAVLIWIFGGLAAICGGLTWAEWALMLPTSGGDTPYLDHVFRRPPKLAPFLYVWCRVLLVNPSTAASLAFISAKFIMRAIPALQYLPDISTGKAYKNDHGIEQIPDDTAATKACWIIKAGAILSLTLMVCCVAFSNQVVVKTQTFLTLLKQLTIIVLIVMGLVKIFLLTETDITAFRPAFPGSDVAPKMTERTFEFASMASAMLVVLFCYDGFANLSTVVGELKNPRRDTLRAILAGTVSVAALYIAINALYFVPFTPNEFFAEKTGSFAVNYMRRVLGMPKNTAVRSIGAVLVFLSAFGSGVGNSYAASRVALAGGAAGFLPAPKLFATVHKKFGTPFNAIMLQYVIATIMILALDPNTAFEVLCMASMYACWIFYALTASALIVLRFTEPERERPFKVFIGCPITVILIGVVLMIMSFFVKNDDYRLIGLYAWAAVAIGIVYYFAVLFRKFSSEKKMANSSR